jgi:tetratricopeptide (TPR) repeat protein
MILQTIKPFFVSVSMIFVLSAAVFAQDDPQPLRRSVDPAELETSVKESAAQTSPATVYKQPAKQTNANRYNRPLSPVEIFYKDLDELDVKAGNTRSARAAYLGNLYLSQAKFKEALFAFNQAINGDPSNAAAYLGRGNVYLYDRKYELAIEDFDRAVFINARLSKAYFGLGQCYLKLGQQLQDAGAENWEITEAFNKAIKNFDSVEEIDLSKADPVIYFKRALAYDGLGFKERAESERRKFEESAKIP